MKQLQRYVGSLLLGASLLAPMGVKAADFTPSPRAEEHVRRYYDREHRDWHNWDDHEARAYRHWLMEERREHRYQEYARLRRQRQAEYWRWRHAHLDWR